MKIFFTDTVEVAELAGNWWFFGCVREVRFPTVKGHLRHFSTEYRQCKFNMLKPTCSSHAFLHSFWYWNAKLHLNVSSKVSSNSLNSLKLLTKLAQLIPWEPWPFFGEEFCPRLPSLPLDFVPRHPSSWCRVFPLRSSLPLTLWSAWRISVTSDLELTGHTQVDLATGSFCSSCFLQGPPRWPGPRMDPRTGLPGHSSPGQRRASCYRDRDEVAVALQGVDHDLLPYLSPSPTHVSLPRTGWDICSWSLNICGDLPAGLPHGPTSSMSQHDLIHLTACTQ